VVIVRSSILKRTEVARIELQCSRGFKDLSPFVVCRFFESVQFAVHFFVLVMFVVKKA